MNFLDIRKLFIKHSGRFDLVTDVSADDYTDNGANFFIHSGQRVLDNKIGVSSLDMIVTEGVTQSDGSIELSNLRSLTRIWVVGNDGEKIMLDQMPLNNFKQKYGSQADEGLPRVYALEPVRESPTDETQVKSTRILIGPASDSSYNIRVEGKFYTDTLVDEGDVNFWTVEYPHTLVQAALYTMERFYRNTQGMRDHMEAIDHDLIGIDFNEVERMVQYRSTMADSFNERTRSIRKSFSV